jgi:hypothetical protein
MIIVQAHMIPNGDEARRYELLHASIQNRTSVEPMDWYTATVIARPYAELGTPGFEADVKIQGVDRRAGFVPLLASVLNTALINVEPNLRHHFGSVLGFTRLETISDYTFTRRVRT